MEPLAVGNALPDMPVFLLPEVHVPVPLGATYETTWNLFPSALRDLFDAAPETA